MNITKRNYLFLIFIVITQITWAQKYSLSGYIKEDKSLELLPGASIYIPQLKVGTISNTYGFYSITLPKGEYDVQISFVGYPTVELHLNLDKNISKDIILNPGQVLEEVTVQAKKIEKISDDVQGSIIKLPIQQVKEIPALLGEKDVLKVIQLMPGVQKGTEGQSGIYVRGGGPDQNLLILDDAPVYNAQHLFGFFSVFNGDALKSTELIKGGFPARYGGRLSSVINMNMKDGNKNKYTGEVGIGLVSSRAVFEGPIVKNKGSFLISGRRTYIDLLMKPLIKSQSKGDDVGYYFYDLNAKANYELNSKNKLYLSGYFGRDIFYYKESKSNNKSKLSWGNQTGTLRWNHQFNSQLFANTSLIYSHYQFLINIDNKFDDENLHLRYNSGIDDIGLKIDFNYYPMPRHTVRFGLASTAHQFTPRAVVYQSSYLANQEQKNNTKINTLENGLYIEDLYKYNRLQIMAGLRLSHYRHSDKNFAMLEPRLSASYKILEDLAVKASYAKTQQYIHLLSNTGVGLPTDLWVPATKNIGPQKAWQVAAGVAKDFLSQNLTFSVEGYYKKMNDIVGYKEGANFMFSDDLDFFNKLNWESMVTKGQAHSYGIELLLQRKIGKLSGWLGYTLSWTKQQFPDVNFGKEYWAKYDRRHDFSAVFSYKVTDNINIGLTWVYASGNAMTMPLASYSGNTHEIMPNNIDNYSSPAVDYKEKNGFRMKPYHRLDFSVQFKKKKKHGIRTWEFGVYNAYSRKNPFFYNVSEENGKTVIKQVSLFPIIPSITYSFKFN